MKGRVIVNRFARSMQQTLHTLPFCSRSFLCKNYGIFFNVHKTTGAKQNHEETCNRRSVDLCAINFDLCGRYSANWRRCAAATACNVEHEHVQHIERAC